MIKLNVSLFRSTTTTQKAANTVLGPLESKFTAQSIFHKAVFAVTAMVTVTVTVTVFTPVMVTEGTE